VAVVERRIVTADERRPVPADMLLVAERRRRLAGSEQVPIVSEEILVSDEDQLIEADDAGSITAGNVAGDLILYRPMTQVTLVQVSWSGPIDHPALQSALSCHRKEPSAADARLGVLAGTPFAARDTAGAALEVTLGQDDLALIEAVVSAGDRAAAAELIFAARLPERLAGAEATTIQAVSHVLAAYRRAALAHAWQRYIGAPESVQLHRERDETAVAVLSTVRALLGER
jgi:hypothetical protein